MTSLRNCALTITGLLACAALAGCGGGTDDPSVVLVARSTLVGSPPAASPAADRSTRARQYIACMRGHKVPMVDEITSEGTPVVDKAHADPDRIGPATRACAALMPRRADQGTALTPAELRARRHYSACIREHGVAAYPSADARTGEVDLSDEAARSLKEDPKLSAAMEACHGVLPAGTPGKLGG